MSLKNTISITGVAFCFAAVNVIPVIAADPQVPCMAREQMMDFIEKVPKSFPYSEKDNVYTIDTNSYGALTVTIDGLNTRFFNSLDSNRKNWGSVANKPLKYGLQGNTDEIGCVIAGVNNYETGSVDKSKDAKAFAQKLFNEYVRFAQSLLK